jgi:hypothetical protein
MTENRRFRVDVVDIVFEPDAQPHTVHALTEPWIGREAHTFRQGDDDVDGPVD